MGDFDDFFAKLLEKAAKVGDLEIENISLEIERFKVNIASALKPHLEQQEAFKEHFRLIKKKAPRLIPHEFQPIEEVIFRRSNGNEIKIGGECAPPFFSFSIDTDFRNLNPNPPRVTYDVFDMKIPLPKTIKREYQEVLTDPAGWAELAVKYGADLITLHFVSTDPGILDTPVSKAAAILEEVLERVKIPIILGGSGNKKKDTELFEELAAQTQGERLMLSSADKVTWDKVVPIARKYGHNVLLWAQLDINDQQKLVEDALAMGMPRDRIVLDPTCATLGYGLEYSYSNYQKIRMAGLNGNKTLNFPMSGGTTNAWGAREAWMKHLNHITHKGGDRELRGPLWEAMTALSMSLVGLDLAMMLHPKSARIFKTIIDNFYGEHSRKYPDYLAWVSRKI